MKRGLSVLKEDMAEEINVVFRLFRIVENTFSRLDCLVIHQVADSSGVFYTTDLANFSSAL